MRGRKKQLKSMKNANGTGSVYKLSGNRRKPWVAVAPAKLYSDNGIDYKYKRSIIGYFENKEDAEHELYLFNKGLLKIDKALFRDMLEEWYSDYYSGLSASRQRAYNVAVQRIEPLMDYPIADITPIIIEELLSGNFPTGSKIVMKTIIDKTFEIACKHEIVTANKAKLVQIDKAELKVFGTHKKKKVLSDDVIKKVLDSEIADIVKIGLYTGLRPSEILQLKKDNVHLEQGYMIGGMKTDAGKDRVIPIHEEIAETISNALSSSSSGTLFKIKYSTYLNKFKMICGDEYTPHCTRHTFVTNAKKCKLDDVAIKLICGHAITDITEDVYTHRDNQYLIDQIAMYKL